MSDTMRGRSRGPIRSLGACAVLAAVVACAPAPEPPTEVAGGPDLAALEARGREVAGAFQTTLKGELMAALPDGAEHAIGVCAVRAPEVAAELSVDGVEIGRATHRARNPDNAASGWLEPVVAEYAAMDGAGEGRLVELPDDRYGWVEPLYVAPPCLTCHGTAVPAKLEAAIREIYPDDRATGFEAGEFRGVVWVTMPAGDG